MFTFTIPQQTHTNQYDYTIPSVAIDTRNELKHLACYLFISIIIYNFWKFSFPHPTHGDPRRPDEQL